MKKEKTVVNLILNREIYKNFKSICVKKDVTISFGMEKLIEKCVQDFSKEKTTPVTKPFEYDED